MRTSTEHLRSEDSVSGSGGPCGSRVSNVSRATRKEVLRERFINEITGYLVANKGPDSEGRAHPTVKRIRLHLLEAAIEEAKKRGLIGEWKPYHFIGHYGTYSKDNYIDELIVKRVDKLLVGKFKGDVFALLTQASKDELLTPFTDEIGGRSIQLSLGRLGPSLSQSPFGILSRYCQLKGLKDYEVIRPYHRQTKSPHGTYQDPSLLDEVLGKKIDQLLNKKFKGDILALVTSTTLEDLQSPLTEEITGRRVEVSTVTCVKMFKESPYAVIKRYIEIKGLDAYRGLKPYHMQSQAPMGTYDDASMTDEVLVKGVDSLLATKFDGNLMRLLTEVEARDLLAPFTDTLGGMPVTVSMKRAGTKFGDSPYAMLARYRELKGLTEFEDLRPYHMQSASRGLFDNPAVIDEIIVKRVNSLLHERFDGDFSKLLTESKAKDLFTPFEQIIAGHYIRVSMGTVMSKLNSSPYELLKRFCKSTGRSLMASKACLVGAPGTRARRLAGEFNSYDRRLMKTLEGDFNTGRFGMRVFNSVDKEVVRTLLLESATAVLGEAPIAYLGLEDQHLESIRLVRSYLNLSPEDSVIVERDARVFAAMNSLRQSMPNGEGKDLGKLQIIQGAVEDKIPSLEGRFNLVNLDFVGHLSQSNVKALRELFSGRLEDKAVIAVTLMDTPLARERTERAGLGTNGARELPRILSDISKANGLYAVEVVGEVPYSGGTGSRKTGMLTYFFSANRISDADSTQNNQ